MPDATAPRAHRINAATRGSAGMAEAATPAATARSAKQPARLRRADPALRTLLLNCRRLQPDRRCFAFFHPPQAATERAVHALALLREAGGDDFQALGTSAALAALPAVAHHALWRLAANFLVHRTPLPGGDPVARFHLDNGARIERLDAQANLSEDLAPVPRRHDRPRATSATACAGVSPPRSRSAATAR
jgi:hypothetical protein